MSGSRHRDHSTVSRGRGGAGSRRRGCGGRRLRASHHRIAVDHDDISEVHRSGASPGDAADQTAPAQWNPFTRIAFRFCFLYFGLYCLLYPQLLTDLAGWLVPTWSWLPDPSTWQLQLLRPWLRWVGQRVFGADEVPLVRTGGRDQLIYWVLLFCLLVIGLVGTAVWTLLARRREYRQLAGWFFLFIRLCVAGAMMNYGLAKLIPTQMPTPPLSTLITPYGDFTPLDVLWYQVGVSPPYQVMLGAAEVLAGILLFVPRTRMAGALLVAVNMSMVFVLDLCFGVHVRTLSGHLLLMSLVLLAPEARRLADVLFLDRPTGASTAPYPFHTRRSRRIAATAQILLGVWMSTAFLPLSIDYWREQHPPASPVHGIWTVTEFTRDGIDIPPLTTDRTRWRRLVFDEPAWATYQRMDDTLVDVHATIDPETRHLELSRSALLATFTYRHDGTDRLHLDGTVDGYPVTLTLDRVDLNSLPLRDHRFHWIETDDD
ncbi:DoxX family protein [Nocardia sp. SSK8]|uniref:DoxX family protein n=1 Tax=Nocardia sp. SSK8 TaxID=3120154 RepID=UPI0030091E90